MYKENIKAGAYLGALGARALRGRQREGKEKKQRERERERERKK